MKFLIIFLFLFSISFVVEAQKEKIILVIDPGHGGCDPGHLSENKKHLPEKDLNLLIAKKFGGYIEQYLQNVTVIYTRTDDSFPSLDERVDQANKINADYFISIHCNANHKKSVHGTESHVHSFSSKKSVDMAKEMEKQFSTRAGRHSRGVKDTGDRTHNIQVLKFTTMTSVLVECGFLTNEKEANYLNTTLGQEILASAIFRAFRTVIVKEYSTISFIKSSSKKKDNIASTNTGATKPSTFTIQIMSSKEPINTDDVNFKKLPQTVTRNKLNTSNAYKYCYTMGNYSSTSEANKDLEQIKKNGFNDAFIIKLE